MARNVGGLLLTKFNAFETKNALSLIRNIYFCDVKCNKCLVSTITKKYLYIEYGSFKMFKNLILKRAIREHYWFCRTWDYHKRNFIF